MQADKYAATWGQFPDELVVTFITVLRETAEASLQ